MSRSKATTCIGPRVPSTHCTSATVSTAPSPSMSPWSSAKSEFAPSRASAVSRVCDVGQPGPARHAGRVTGTPSSWARLNRPSGTVVVGLELVPAALGVGVGVGGGVGDADTLGVGSTGPGRWSGPLIAAYPRADPPNRASAVVAVAASRRRLRPRTVRRTAAGPGASTSASAVRR
ncbi:hypothetical protein ACWD8I_10665 [Micromonospora arida]